MDLSIVIGYYNEHDTVKFFLENLSTNPPDCAYEVVIATDATYGKEITDSPVPMRQVFTKRQSFSEAFNDALATVESEFVVIANCDVVLFKKPTNWFEICVDALIDTASVCAVPKVNVGPIPRPPTVLINKYTLPSFFWFLHTKDVQIPFFDEVYKDGSHHEDSDKTKEWYSKRQSVAILHEFTIYHSGQGCLRKKPSFDKRFKKNREIFIEKWGEEPNNEWLGKLNGSGEW